MFYWYERLFKIDKISDRDLLIALYGRLAYYSNDITSHDLTENQLEEKFKLQKQIIELDTTDFSNFLAIGETSLKLNR